LESIHRLISFDSDNFSGFNRKIIHLLSVFFAICSEKPKVHFLLVVLLKSYKTCLNKIPLSIEINIHKEGKDYGIG